jgi:hypothetical protein
MASSRYPTYLIPDDGTRYARGQLVSVDQSSGQVHIVMDPEGSYEVMNSRPATEHGGGPALLRVDLKKRTPPPVEEADPWSFQPGPNGHT